MTRKTTAHLFCSLNGVVESPDLFQFDAFGAEEGQLMGRATAGASDVIIGRTLWQEWSQYWPNADDAFGQFINPVRKHVLTSAPSDDLGWNSTAIREDPVHYVRQLQHQGTGDIIIAGGIQTVRSLFLTGVVDALTLTIHPAVTNQGSRLFDDSVPLTRLQLLDSVITSAGNAILTYGLRSAPGV